MLSQDPYPKPVGILCAAICMLNGRVALNVRVTLKLPLKAPLAGNLRAKFCKNKLPAIAHVPIADTIVAKSNP
jgi:hypothetical protein